jgi:hypothetical protein
MSGFYRIFTRRFAAVAIVALALALSAGRAFAQENEPDEGGMEDSSLTKRPKADSKTATASPENTTAPSGISYTTRLDHTAIWVGDQFHYQVIVDFSPDFEFVLDNLTKEQTNMDPFQVMDVSKRTSDLANKGKRLFVDITMSSFGTGQASATIPQLTLYYYRKDKKSVGPEQQAAESLTIPGPVIGLRSTLPPQPSDLRDAITVSSWDRSRWVLPIAAWFATGFLLIGIGFEGVQFYRRQKARKGPDPRKAMEAVRAKWASSVPADFSDPKATAQFYSQSYQNVKEYVGYFLETPMLGLTSDEMQEEMNRHGASPDFTKRVSKVLESCESSLYAAPNGVSSNPDTARAVAQDVREIFNTKE